MSRLSLFPLLLLAGACAGPQQHHSASDLSSAGKEVGARFLAAFNRGDADAVMKTYWHSPELVYFGLDGMGMRGWDAVKQDMVGLFKMMPGAKLEFLEQHDDPQGEVIVGWGTWKMTVPSAGGSQLTLQGRYSDVKAQRDGQWVYILDHASLPMQESK